MTRLHWVAIPGSILLLLFLLPLLSIFIKLDYGNLLPQLHQALVYEALRLSFTTSLVSILLIVTWGTPMAYLMSRTSFKGKGLLESLVDLPMVLPPAVAGVALLMAFGRRGMIGQYLGFNLSFSTAAVVLAQIFVAAPFFIRSARNSFSTVDLNLERASQTLGVSPWRTFWRITMPLSLPGLVGGAVMSWARALGEFGATIMFAGNLQGVTRTLPLAIYTAMESDFQAAMVIAAIMIVFSMSVLIMVRVIFKLP